MGNISLNLVPNGSVVEEQDIRTGGRTNGQTDGRDEPIMRFYLHIRKNAKSTCIAGRSP